MEFNFSDFILGLNDALVKAGNEEAVPNVFDVKGSIFPTIASQTKWHFARNHEHLHLSDGNNVYSFHLPEGEQEHDFPVVKKESLSIHEFGLDAHGQGTAQVHRADPGHIYFTLQDGHKNPTYTFKHESEDKWRAIPKVKHESHSVIGHEEFIKGASSVFDEQGLAAGVLDKLVKGMDTVGRAGIRGTMALGDDPMLSAGAGLLGGAAYDLGKRHFYNSNEENEQEDWKNRLPRYLLPAAALGGTGALAKNLFPNYYSQYPTFRP